MNRRLKDIATIQFGLYNKPATEGEIFYLQNTTFMKEMIEKSFNTYLSRKDVSPNHIVLGIPAKTAKIKTPQSDWFFFI